MTGGPSRRSFVAGAVGLPIALALPRATPAADPTLHEIYIESFAFRPERLTVRPGDILRWTNKDLSPHTATAEDGTWDTGELAQGASAEVTVTGDMTGDYFCAFHPQMRARVIVA